VQATDGNLYGTTVGGGTLGHGTLFRIDPSGGNFSDQYNYGVEGNPASPLLQNTNGIFYGKTELGGTAGDGVFYSFGTTNNPNLVRELLLCVAEKSYGRKRNIHDWLSETC